jgi:hypothetical protein
LKPLGSAIHIAGSRFAKEFHGGKAGRVLMVLRDGQWMPRRCECGGIVAFDRQGRPHCLDCGIEVRKNASGTQIERRKYAGLKAAKKFRMYG